MLYKDESMASEYGYQKTEFVAESTARQLRNTISRWYKILRAVALTVALIVLIFIGIKIVTVSNNAEKAKYKEMIVDWIVSICLIFIMNYIMIFANQIVKITIKFIDSLQFVGTEIADDQASLKFNMPQATIIEEDDEDHVKNAYKILVGEANGSEYEKLFFKENMLPYTGEGDPHYLVWPTENFMQQARIKAQLMKYESGEDSSIAAIGYKLIYVVLVIYTLIFIWTYVKRILYLAFLTIIAPFVALTYPIDKITDGKAQAFDMWIKEYIFNLLIQPMHLLLYIVLIGSALEFASRNIIYVVVALGFMTPAEKIVRKFFGFEKAHTPGLLAGPAGHALMITGLGKLRSLGRSPRGGRGGETSGASGGKINNNDIRFGKGNDSVDKFAGIGVAAEEKETRGNIISQPAEQPIELSKTEDRMRKIENEDYNYTSNPEWMKLNRKRQEDIAKQQRRQPKLPELTPEQIEKRRKEYLDKQAADGRRLRNLQGYTNPKSANYMSEEAQRARFEDAQNKRRRKQEKKENRRKIASGIKGGIKGYAGRVLKVKGDRLSKKYTLRNAARFAGKVQAGAVGAVAGGIASISSGDPTKVAQGTITGAYAGSTIGGRATDWAGDRVGEYDVLYNQGNQQAITEGYYGSDYLQHRREQAEEKYMKNDDNIAYISSHLGVDSKEAKELMQSDVVKAALNSGINDMTSIATLIDMTRGGVSTNNAIAQAMFAKDMGKRSTTMSDKEYDEARTRIARGYKAKNAGVSDNQAKAIAERIMKQVDGGFYTVRTRIKQNDPDKD